LHDGTPQHARISRTAQRIVDADALRRGLLIIVVALAALLLATIMGSLNLLASGSRPVWPAAVALHDLKV
jgi:hypothetical protein